MGTEVGQLGGYGFQGPFFGVDGSCKDGTMGSGCSRHAIIGGSRGQGPAEMPGAG
jgi:hypothetical protein